MAKQGGKEKRRTLFENVNKCVASILGMFQSVLRQLIAKRNWNQHENKSPEVL